MWESRSDFQPQARVWNGCGPEGRPAGAFPVDPEGERSEFREAESSRKSTTLSMAEHGPRRVGRRVEIRQRGGLGGSFAARPVLADPSVEVTLEVGGGNDR